MIFDFGSIELQKQLESEEEEIRPAASTPPALPGRASRRLSAKRVSSAPTSAAEGFEEDEDSEYEERKYQINVIQRYPT